MGQPLTYEKTISITDESGTVRNIINYRTYTKSPAESDSGTADKKQEGGEEGGSNKGAPKNPTSAPQGTPLKKQIKKLA